MNKVSLLKVMVLSMSAPLILFSCKAKKITQSTAPVAIENVPSSSLTADLLLAQAIQYTHWKGKAASNFQGAGMDQDITLTIESIFQKQTYLAASAGMFGLSVQAATALATPDSIKALDKINANYYAYEMDQAAQLINAPIDFEMLQALLVGNPILKNAKVKHWSLEDSVAKIVRTVQDFEETLEYNTQTRHLKRITLLNVHKNFRAIVDFEDYRQALPAKAFAYKRQIVLDYEGQRSRLSLSFTEVNFKDPFEIKFSIPTSYRLRH